MKHFSNFDFQMKTEIIFGKDAELRTAEMIKKYGGSKVMIVMDGGEMVMDGVPGEILTRRDELRAIGLDVPHTVDLLHGLREDGFDVPVNALSVADCAEVICRALK